MIDDQLELIIVNYVNSGEAKRTLEDLHKADQQRKLNLLYAATLSKAADGKTKITETADPKADEGRIFGAAIGAVFGAALGPGGGIAGAAIGGAVGAMAGMVTGDLTARLVDSGINDKYLKSIVEKLPPTESALVVVVEVRFLTATLEIVEAYHAEIRRYPLELESKGPTKPDDEASGDS